MQLRAHTHFVKYYAQLVKFIVPVQKFVEGNETIGSIVFGR